MPNGKPVPPLFDFAPHGQSDWTAAWLTPSVLKLTASHSRHRVVGQAGPDPQARPSPRRGGTLRGIRDRH